MDKTDRLRDYGLAFLLYEHGLGICGYELIRELFIVFIKLILNSYLFNNVANIQIIIDNFTTIHLFRFKLQKKTNIYCFSYRLFTFAPSEIKK